MGTTPKNISPCLIERGNNHVKQSQQGTHTHMCEHNHVHEHIHTRLQPYADNAEIFTVEFIQADLLRWHYRLVHLSFNLIKAMAEVGLLSNKLAKAPIPKCAGCMFAATTKEPWRSKGKNTSD